MIDPLLRARAQAALDEAEQLMSEADDATHSVSEKGEQDEGAATPHVPDASLPVKVL